jgi:biofilm PGA synthesis N-glycosyltransferase PgaC
MTPRILIISPVRNESAHIERVVRAVAAQTLAPARWVVIDDRSDDATPQILRALEPEVPFLTVMQAPPPADVAGPDRLARALEVRAFNLALATVDVGEFTHVMKLDGDIELPPEYLAEMARRFDAEPELGLAGGVLDEPSPAGMRRISIPRTHVHGALKLYTRECFERIGGMPERLGWDTIDETFARMRGFRTRSFEDVVSIHHRPLASADGQLRGHARHGECAYIAHYPALWVALRAVKVATRKPLVVSGCAFFYGFARAAWRRTERVPDSEYRRFARRELRSRMLATLRVAPKV